MSEFNPRCAWRANQLMVSASVTAMVALIAGGAIAQPNSGAAAPSSQVETVVVTGTSLRNVAPVGSSVISLGVGEPGEEINKE